MRKFGANILQHPRGVTVDNKGRIIVVECKVMRVIIFDQAGNVLNKFGCSKHLEFPNGVVVNDRQEIFISDNRAHCVKVFNYEGVYLRQIGGEGNNQLLPQTIWRNKIALLYDFCCLHNSLKFEPKKFVKMSGQFHFTVSRSSNYLRQINGEGNNQLVGHSFFSFSFFYYCPAVVSNFMLFHLEGYILILSYFTRKAIF